MPQEILATATLDAHLDLPEEATKRFNRVLRLSAGTLVELFDGQGGVVRARWKGDSSGTVTVLEGRTVQASAPEVIVVQALVRSAKLEQVIQRSTELGATSILLWNADRSDGRWFERARKSLKDLETVICHTPVPR